MADWSRSSRPPEELRIVLLGSHSDVKTCCGNTIFGHQVFSDSPSSLHLFERHDGMVLNRRLAIINTPDLLNQAPDERDLKRFFHLSFPEPHVLLLVLKSGTFTAQDRDVLRHINIIYGAGASECVIVVFMHEEQMEYVSIRDSDSESVKSLLQTCRRPHHHLQRNGDQSQVQKLLENIERMVEENRGHGLKIPDVPVEKETVYQTTIKIHKNLSRGAQSMNQRPISQPKTENLIKFVRSHSTRAKKSLESVRIVLVGKTGVGKSATGNTILGRDAFPSKASMKSVTKMCQRESGEVCGRPVTVVDTPGLFDTSLSNQEIQQEIMRCIELSAPGPHVFLLVIAVGPFTQEERETLQLIKMTFGQKAETYSMVLFTRGDNLSDQSIEDYINEGDPQVQKLIHDCGGKFHVFNNKQKHPEQVVSLLKKIDKMIWNNDGSFYNDEMFQGVDRALKLVQNSKEKEEEVRRELEALRVKHESEIKEYKEKLEREIEKGKVRERLRIERENTLLRKYRVRQKKDDADPEQRHDQCESTAHVEKKNNDHIEKLEKLFSGMTDLDRQTAETERESDKDHKKNKVQKAIETLKRGKKQRGRLERGLEDCNLDGKVSAEEKPEQIKHSDTDGQINEGLPEKERLLLHYQEMEECRQKLDEAMKKYKETADMYAVEIREIEARNAINIDNWQKSHRKPCVIQ